MACQCHLLDMAYPPGDKTHVVQHVCGLKQVPTPCEDCEAKAGGQTEFQAKRQAVQAQLKDLLEHMHLVQDGGFFQSLTQVADTWKTKMKAFTLVRDEFKKFAPVAGKGRWLTRTPTPGDFVMSVRGSFIGRVIMVDGQEVFCKDEDGATGLLSLNNVLTWVKD